MQDRRARSRAFDLARCPDNVHALPPRGLAQIEEAGGSRDSRSDCLGSPHRRIVCELEQWHATPCQACPATRSPRAGSRHSTGHRGTGGARGRVSTHCEARVASTPCRAAREPNVEDWLMPCDRRLKGYSRQAASLESALIVSRTWRTTNASAAVRRASANENF